MGDGASIFPVVDNFYPYPDWVVEIMTKILFTLLMILMLPGATAFPQHVSRSVAVVDEVDGKAVAYAQVINEKGVTVGFTDERGVLPENINEGKVTIQHLSYLPKEVERSEFGNDTCIRLTPRKYSLGEVSVTPQDNDYIHLRTYFRSYQLNDSCLKYFKDGFADFFIKLKGKKVKRVVSQVRVLENGRLMSEDKKRANMLVDKYIATPYLEKYTLLERLKKEGYGYPSDSVLAYLYRDETQVGVVKRDTVNGVCTVTYDALENKGEKKGTLFGYTTRLVDNYQTEVYKDEGDAYKSYIDLICKRGYRKLFYKHKKDAKEQMIEVVDELYVLKGECVSADRMKELVSGLESAEGEASVDALEVPPLSEHLTHVLRTEMTPAE